MTTPLARLTPAQLRILRVLHGCGWLYKQASVELGVPEATVRTTVYRAARRAGVTDRASLAYWLGIEDAQELRSHATLAGTSAADGGALGRAGRSDGGPA